MRYTGRHIGWLLVSILMLTLVSCATDDEPKEPKEKPVLKIYLFAPDSPIITRGEIGNVDASDEEKAINTIDVWAFEHNNDHKLVGYVHLANPGIVGSKEIAMEISDDFAKDPNKPNVDIYVAANVTSANCGLTLDKTTTYTQLKEKLIGSGYFGLAPFVSAVPNEGLPMSGCLEDQPVSGTSPVFSARQENVKLVRAVSKMRFIFSKSNAAHTISNLSISLNSGVLPNTEYLFLDGVYPTASPTYNPSAVTLVSGKGSGDINACTNPVDYAYLETETGQQYETKINNGLTIHENQAHADLSELGRFYLRESDKMIAGTITYNLVEGENPPQKTVPFSMAAAGDFTRNHTWIVYGYFLGDGNLMLNVVDVKSWDNRDETGKIYNW